MSGDDLDIEIPLTRKGVAWGFAVTCFVWIFFGLCVPIAIWDFITHLFPNTKVEKLGQIGDMFGAVNALFSSMAFFAAIMAVMLQVKQMKESSKRELEQNKLQTRQSELAQKTTEIQERMHNLELRNDIRSALLKVNRDVARIAISGIDCHPFNLNILVQSVASNQRAERERQKSENEQLHQSNRVEIQNDQLELKITLGESTAALVQLLNELLTLTRTTDVSPSGEDLEKRGKALPPLQDKIRDEIESLWTLHIKK